MCKYRCNGEGVVLGKKVAVRERTRLKDKGFFIGEVIYVPEGGCLTDVVFVLDEAGLIRSTKRHCVFATKANLDKLHNDVQKAITKYSKEAQMLFKERKLCYEGLHKALEVSCSKCESSFDIMESITRAYEQLFVAEGEIQSLVWKLQEFMGGIHSLPTFKEPVKQEEEVCREKESEEFKKAVQDILESVENLKKKFNIKD